MVRFNGNDWIINTLCYTATNATDLVQVVGFVGVMRHAIKPVQTISKLFTAGNF